MSTSARSRQSSGLAVFDFDRTLSVVHVYQMLCGGGRSADVVKLESGPYARTELGQLRLIEELEKRSDFQSSGGFAVAVFGGAARAAWLRDMLQSVRQRGFDLAVCSKGMCAVVRRCLADVGLLGFFSHVFARVGEEYGQSDFDASALQGCPPSSDERAFLGAAADAAWKKKSFAIRHLANQLGLTKENVVLVDDDPKEIMTACSVCTGVLVQGTEGVGSDEFTELLGILPPKPESLSCNQSHIKSDQELSMMTKSRQSAFDATRTCRASVSKRANLGQQQLGSSGAAVAA